MPSNNTKTNPPLLKELIRQIRQELTEVVEERIENKEAPLFSINKITLEVHFVVEASDQKEAGVSAKLLAVAGFKVGAEQKYSTEQIQKITLELSAIQPSKSARDTTENDPAGTSDTGDGGGYVLGIDKDRYR